MCQSITFPSMIRHIKHSLCGWLCSAKPFAASLYIYSHSYVWCNWKFKINIADSLLWNAHCGSSFTNVRVLCTHFTLGVCVCASPANGDTCVNPSSPLYIHILISVSIGICLMAPISKPFFQRGTIVVSHNTSHNVRTYIAARWCVRPMRWRRAMAITINYLCLATSMARNNEATGSGTARGSARWWNRINPFFYFDSHIVVIAV